MQKNQEIFILYFGYIIELIAYICLKYAKYYKGEFSLIKVENVILKNMESKYSFLIGFIISFTFYILAMIYVAIIVYKYKNNMSISLKKNNLVLLIMLITDWLLCLLNIRAMISSSYAFRFVIICLLTNLVVYIKYKKNNIKIE